MEWVERYQGTGRRGYREETRDEDRRLLKRYTFRHTVASRLFAEGRNILQVQRWLGHHSPSFTLDTYVHLLEKDLGRPLKPLWVKEKPGQGPEKRRKRRQSPHPRK
ncbi:MAG: tyrosine-type recombinase/integrase [Solirubrobacteraceae bacterium]